MAFEYTGKTNGQPQNYQVANFKFDPKTGQTEAEKREKPTEAAAWGEKPPTILSPEKELPDSAIQPLEEERNPTVATDEWNQLNEVTRKNYQEFFEIHQGHELEVQTLESQLSMVTKLFNSRLKEAREKMLEARGRIDHPMYKEAASIYERMRAEESHSEEKAATVKDMMDRRDQLKEELTEINSSWMKRLLKTGRDKAKKLQEIENRLKHPMYKIKKKEEGPKTLEYTEYDLKQNYLRLVREQGESGDETEHDRIENQITDIRKEMAIRGMDDPEVALAPKQKVKTYIIPEAEIKEAEGVVEVDEVVEADEKTIAKPIIKDDTSLPGIDNDDEVVQNAEEWSQQVKEINEPEVEELEITEIKKSITDLIAKVDDLRLTQQIGTILEQLRNAVRKNKINDSMVMASNIREEIIGSKIEEEKYIQGVKFYNELRGDLKNWKERTELGLGDEYKELEVVSSRDIIVERGQIYEAQHGGAPKQRITSHERRMRKQDSAESTEIIEDEGVNLYINGDDVYTFDPNQGIGIIADGVSTGSKASVGTERPSRQMARLGTLGLAKLFKEAQKLTSVEEKKSLLEEKLNELISLLIEGKATGGMTLLGTLYLPETNQLLVVDIGNCQLAAQQGGKFTSLKPKSIKRGMREPLTITKPRGSDKAKIVDHRPTAEKTPYVYLIDLNDYTDEQGEIRLLIGSDGYEESTGKDLATAGSRLVSEGVSGAIKRIKPKDDISIVDLRIPAKKTEKPVRQTA